MKLSAFTLLVLTLVLLSIIASLRFFFSISTIPNISTVEAIGGVGIYWDEKCTRTVNSVDWGSLSLGSTKQIVVYVRNEALEACFLYLIPTNWNPERAAQYLTFFWNRLTSKVEVNEIVQVTQGLRVFPYTSGISTFSFDIIFELRTNFLGDINLDGKVNIFDIVIACSLFGLTPQSVKWNPAADLDKNSVINIYDIILTVRDFARIA